jgi:hypothetical protein
MAAHCKTQPARRMTRLGGRAQQQQMEHSGTRTTGSTHAPSSQPGAASLGCPGPHGSQAAATAITWLINAVSPRSPRYNQPGAPSPSRGKQS